VIRNENKKRGKKEKKSCEIQLNKEAAGSGKMPAEHREIRSKTPVNDREGQVAFG